MSAGLPDFGMGVPDLSLLAALGPLQYTLRGMQAQTSMEGQQDALSQELAAKTRAASQQAQQAQGQYQQAANAPVPQNPLGDLIQRSLGNAASVIGQTPAYRQSAESNIALQHADILKRREDNIAALAKIYAQKADAFQQAGQTEAAEKQRILERKMLEQQQNIRFAHDDLLNRARMQGEMERTQARVQGMLEAAGIRAGASAGPTSPGADLSFLDKYIKTTSTGKQFLDASNLQGKQKEAAVMYSAQKGVPLFGKDETGQVNDIETARKNNVAIQSQLQDLLPKDAENRFANLPAIKMSQLLQTSDKRGAFNSWRAAAIRNLRAMAGSRGFRMTEAEIKLAIKNDIPSITDTYGVAQQKMKNVEAMLDNAETPLFGEMGAPTTGGGMDHDKIRSILNGLGR